MILDSENFAESNPTLAQVKTNHWQLKEPTKDQMKWILHRLGRLNRGQAHRLFQYLEYIYHDTDERDEEYLYADVKHLSDRDEAEKLYEELQS